MAKIPRVGPGGRKLAMSTGVAEVSPQQVAKKDLATSQLFKVVQAGADKFEQLHTKNQVDSAKIKSYESMSEIDAMAKSDPDIDNPEVQEKYNTMMEDSKADIMSGISLPYAKNAFSNEYDFSAIKNKVQIASYGRSKGIEKAKGNTSKKILAFKDQYNVAGKDERVGILADVNREINALESIGGISSAKSVDLKEEYKEEFEMNAAREDTERYGADYVITHMGDYDVKDKSKMLAEVKSLGLMKKKEFELNEQLKYQQTQSEIIKILRAWQSSPLSLPRS